VVARERASRRVHLVDDLSDRRIVNRPRASRDVELIVNLRVGKRVQREAAVAPQVVDLGRLVADEEVETVVGNDRTDGMDAGATVLADRRQIPEPDSKLVDKRTSGFGHRRLRGGKLTPSLHPNSAWDLRCLPRPMIHHLLRIGNHNASALYAEPFSSWTEV